MGTYKSEPSDRMLNSTCATDKEDRQGIAHLMTSPGAFAAYSILVIASWYWFSTGSASAWLFPKSIRSNEVADTITAVHSNVVAARRTLEASAPSSQDIAAPTQTSNITNSPDAVKAIVAAESAASLALEALAKSQESSRPTVAELGQYGDMFGGLTSLYSALTLIVAIFVALKEARASKEQRSELQAQSLERGRQAFESIYSLLMEQLRTERASSYTYKIETLATIKIQTEANSLRNIMSDIREKWLHLVTRDIQSTSISTDEIERILVDAFIKKNEELFECCHVYFRLLYRILQSIDESTLDSESKTRYARILRDSLVQSELTVLVFNGCSDESPRLNELLLRYDMMENVELDRSEESKEWQRKIMDLRWKIPTPLAAFP